MLNCLLDSSAAQKHPLYTDIFTGILFFRQDILQSVILNKLHCKKVVGRWLVSGRPTTYHPPTDHLLTDHLPTTYQPLTDHIPTTYRPCTDHLLTTFLRCSLFNITPPIHNNFVNEPPIQDNLPYSFSCYFFLFCPKVYVYNA